MEECKFCGTTGNHHSAECLNRTKKAIYVGSFDLLTNGHYWMIRQGIEIFKDFIVAVGTNPDKKTLFSVQERTDIIQKCFPDIKVVEFGKEYTAKYCVENDIQFILRGVRSVKDYEAERGMRHINEDISDKVTTVFLMPPRNLSEVSSSMVKGLIGFKGWQRVIERYVPQEVYVKLLEKFKDKL